MGNRLGRLGQWLEQIGGWIIAGIGFLMGLALTYYSAFYTEVYREKEDGSLTVRDSIAGNLLALAVAALLLCLIYLLARYRRQWLKRIERALLIFALVFSFSAGLAWIMMSHDKPSADAGSVCLVAKYMLEGDYPMQPPTYMGFNPQQYGMVFILHCMYALFGAGNYVPWQVMNVLLFPVMIFAGYRILKLLSENEVACILYLAMTLVYLPYYFYLPYVYGDFPSVTCGLILMWQTIAYCKTGKNRFVAGAAAAAAFGCLVRKNTIIAVIACCLVLLVYSVKKVHWKPLVMIAVIILTAWGADKGVILYYEHLSGQQVSPGIPSACYIMMGLEDTDKGPGWYNGDNYAAYVHADYDYEAANEYGKAQVAARLHEFWENKTYAVDFFRRKILSQWNMPDCYGIAETANFTCEREELPGFVQSVYFGAAREVILKYLNGYQLVLYFFYSVAMGFILFRRNREMEFYLIPASIIGGMLFSVLWEAMSRYVFPYEAYMILPAAMGMSRMLGCIKNRNGRQDHD